MESIVAVDPYCTGFQSVGNLNRGLEVGCVHGSGEAVRGVVANLDSVGLILELGDCADGAEDLLLLDLHVFCDIGENGRLDEEALVTLAFTAGLYCSTSALAVLDIASPLLSNNRGSMQY